MKLAVVPALLFSLLAVPAFAGLFDNAADELQKAEKERWCCFFKLNRNPKSQYQIDVGECIERSPSKELLDVPLMKRCYEEVGEQYCPSYSIQLKEVECIKEGFSQRQCAAAVEAGKLQAYEECPPVL